MAGSCRSRPARIVQRAAKSALLVLLLFIATMTGLTSCTTTIVPPAQPVDPVTVFLLDHGRTPSLVVPADSGTIVRYAYGDWDYYALRKNDFGHGLAALVGISQGALGRKELSAKSELEAVRSAVVVGSEHIYELHVERERADALRAKLDDIFEANRASLVINEPYDFEFVHHPKRYSYFYNSNHAVADWLRELGCNVKGPTFSSNWRLKQHASQ